MGYYVRRRDGTNQFFEDDVPVAQAVAQVREQDGYETNEGLLGDLGDALSGAGLAGITGALGQAMDFFGGPLTIGRRIAGQDTPGTGIAEMGRRHQARELETLSPEMARDISQEGWDQLNPGNVAFQSVASAPFMIGAMGPGLAARAAGAGPRTAGAVSAISEGGLSAGAVADQIEQEIAQIAAFEPETFLNSPLGREAMAEANGDYERAVEIAQVRGKGVAPLAAGAITAAVSRVGINPFASQSGGLARRVLMGAGREGFEEFVQSGQEQVAANVDIRGADPERSLLEDVPESAVMGALSAAPMGGAFGALSGAGPNPGVDTGDPNNQLEGPAMPPPGGPGARPEGGLGTGNPPGWVPPDTANAEDADFRELGEGEIEDQRPRERPKGWKKGTESWAQPAPEPEPEAAAESTAEQYAQQYAAQSEIREYNEDEDAEWASELETNFRQNGMASDIFPDKSDVVERIAEPVPMWRPGRHAIEASDDEAHAIYGAANAADVPIKDTAVFGLYSRMDRSMFVDERGDGSKPDGYGIKIIDKLKDGSDRVSYVYTGADTMQQAELDAAPYRPKKAAQQAAEPIGEGSSLTEPQEATQEAPSSVEDSSAVQEEIVRQTGQDVVATDKIRNLKPAANEALNAYRQKGEVGLQKYLAGLNVTAAKSLLKNLGGQSIRTDKLAEVQGKIVRQVRNMAKSADKRGLPSPQEEIVTPEANTNIPDVSKQPDVRVESNTETPKVRSEPTQEDYKEMARQRIEDAQAKTAERTTRSVMGETDAFSVKRPSRLRDKASALGAKRKPVAQEATEPAPEQEQPVQAETRSPAQIKEALRDAAALDDDAYDDAVSKLNITPEEAAAVREAMKTDKGLDNLRPTFNDALRASKARPSRQTAEAPKKESKPAAPKRERAEVNVEKARKEQDAADRNLARDMARSMPKDYDLVRRTVDEYLEVERDRIGARSDDRWFKAWPIARQERLIQRVWNAVSGEGPMESRVYRQGANVPYDLNPLMLFSQAERMARSFPEERSTRMHMMRWMEKRVRKAELAFMDFENEFAKAGKTGNPLVDRATKQELLEFVQNRKLRLNVSYAYGKVKGSYLPGEKSNWDLQDKAADFAGFSATEELYPDVHEYTILGADALRNNLITVGIVVEPGQPGSEYSGGHIGGKGGIGSFIAHDMAIELDGKKAKAFSIAQGQFDYHDARPEQYVSFKDRRKRAKALRDEIEVELQKINRPYKIMENGIFTSYNQERHAIDRESYKQGLIKDFDEEPSYSAILGFGPNTGVGGSGYPYIPSALVDKLYEYDKLNNREWSGDRDVDAPYRYTHPELMFRTAFMMAVSSGHDALLWPTANTIRMYPGHSTYKGDFYDKRWPTYAKSWLGEFNPQVNKISVEHNIKNFADIGLDEVDPRTFDEIVDDGMVSETRDQISDMSVNHGRFWGEHGWFLNEVLDDLSGALAENHGRWTERLGTQAGGAVHSYMRNAAALEARKWMQDSYDDFVEQNESNLPPLAKMEELAEEFATGYFNRFIEVIAYATENEQIQQAAASDVFDFNKFIERNMSSTAFDMIARKESEYSNYQGIIAFSKMSRELLDQLSYSHQAWIDGLDMRSRLEEPGRDRFDPDYYGKEVRRIASYARQYFENNKDYYPALKDDRLTGRNAGRFDSAKQLEEVAVNYFGSFISINETALDKERASKLMKKKAEVYVMRITPEMRASFLETGAPMFNRPSGQNTWDSEVLTELGITDEMATDIMLRAIEGSRLSPKEKRIQQDLMTAVQRQRKQAEISKINGEPLLSEQISTNWMRAVKREPLQSSPGAPIQADDVPIRPKKWVNEMERAIKVAAACAAGAPATGAAASMAIGFGASLGISAPLAMAIAGQAESDRLYQQAMGMTRELRRQAGLLPANDYVNDQGTFVAPEYDSEGFVEPVMPADPTQYSNAELRAAEEEIRSLSPRAIITDADIRRQADVRRNELRFRPISELNAEDQP